MFTNGNPQDNGVDEEILEIYRDKLDTPRVGSVVRGTIIQIRDNEVLVDVGLKSEGAVRISELQDEEGNLPYKVGDEVDVFIERASFSAGHTNLSRLKAIEREAQTEMERAFNEEEEVNVKVVKKIKGGYEVDYKGVRGFLPSSQADVRKRFRPNITGETIAVKVIQFNPRKKSIVVSRKVVLEKELEEMKRQALETLEEDQVVKGTVKNLTEYGAFVDVGGIDGLLHVTDLSWGRVNHPREVLKTGDEIEVKVLSIDYENEKVSLGLKQMQEDPWELALEKYPLGKKVKGKVVSLVEYGAFVQLEPGMEGLLHVSELSWTKKIHRPSQILNVGDEIEVAITDVNIIDRKISLSLKQTLPNPWFALAEKIHVGDKIKGQVRNLTEFGAFVEIEEGIDGLVHISDIVKNRTLEHPSEVLQKGQEVEAIITGIDTDRQRISLSIKDAIPDEWDAFVEEHEIADTLEGTVSRIVEFGVFIEVAKGVEGLVHITEIKRAPNQRLERMFSPGDTVNVRIIRIDRGERRLGLSLKDVDMEGDEE